MSERDHGGAAFPHEYWHDGMPWVAPGMSLRDWFAGQAIAGILANPDISASLARLKVTTAEFREDTARTAYQMADALLGARGK